MNRTFRVTGIGVVAVTALVLVARADDKAPAIEGAWRQVENRNGEAQEYQKNPEGTEVIDHIVGGRFVLTILRDKKLVALIGGRTKLEKDKFSEIIEYVTGEIPETFVGSTFDFTVKFDGSTFTKVGTIKVNGQDYKIDENWERCKP